AEAKRLGLSLFAVGLGEKVPAFFLSDHRGEKTVENTSANAGFLEKALFHRLHVLHRTITPQVGGGNTPLKERRGDHQPPMAGQRVLLGTQQSHPILCPCLPKPVETALEEVRHSDALIIDAPSLIVKVGCFRTAAEEVAEKEIGQPDLFQSLFQFRTVELRQ